MNSVSPQGAYREVGIGAEFLLRLEARCQNVGRAEVGMDQRDVESGVRRYIAKGVRKGGGLLVGGQGEIEERQDVRSVSGRTVGNDRILIVHGVERFAKYAETTAQDRL